MATACARRWDAVILGAGASGLISARILQQRGVKRVLLIDRYARAGGNHIDVRAGDYTFDIGFFVFQGGSPFMRYFPEIEDLYVNGAFTCSRVAPSGEMFEYPFSLKREIIARGPGEWFAVAASVLKARIFGRRIVSARDYARYWMGDRFFRSSGLERYIERFYGLPSEQIEREFAEKRMTWIARSASPASIARRLSGLLRNAPPAAQSRDLVRPKRGFSAIYDTVRASLEAGGAEFELGRELGGIRREDGVFVIEGSDGFSVRTERLISTIPVQECLRLCRLPVRSALVETSTLVSLCFSFAGQREFGSTILYNFSHSGDWKRITMASAFYGTIEGREYFTVEINRNASAGAISLEEEERAFRRDAAQKKLFIGDLRLETSHVLENAYPVYRFGATAAAAEAVKHLADFGVESFGRQGGFDYLPNTRDVIETAERRLSVRSTRLYA